MRPPGQNLSDGIHRGDVAVGIRGYHPISDTAQRDLQTFGLLSSPLFRFLGLLLRAAEGFTEADENRRRGQVNEQTDDVGRVAQIELPAGCNEQIVTEQVAESSNEQRGPPPADPDGNADCPEQGGERECIRHHRVQQPTKQHRRS
ncbi:hypothetical protein ETAA8_28300 [Anatilimnocola aggregata]|uniref:Uncharacterized protein n=1 Tax=Anatilimnocola aggregata TaxID=2528021 RepID=A0A517YBX5_9BACT|nr:hypothetical protein ETAA8_28300 [Anatilimnocola aggregata]